VVASAAALALATPAGAYVLPGGLPTSPPVARTVGLPIGSPAGSPGYAFSTLNNDNDVTFNQLLGINNEFVIAGYFGSGAQGHPNKGYQLLPPYAQGNYVNENFPRSVQTQVTGLNDNGVTVGFWAPTNNANQVNANFGFYAKHGRFHEVNFPTKHNSTPPVNQLLGVNDSGVAIGFYTDNNGNNHGYEFNIYTHRFTRVNDSRRRQPDRRGDQQVRRRDRFLHQRRRGDQRVPHRRRPRDHAVLPRRRVHHGARRQRQEGGRRRVRAQRQPERARRLHLDAARRLHHRQ